MSASDNRDAHRPKVLRIITCNETRFAVAVNVSDPFVGSRKNSKYISFPAEHPEVETPLIDAVLSVFAGDMAASVTVLNEFQVTADKDPAAAHPVLSCQTTLLAVVVDVQTMFALTAPTQSDGSVKWSWTEAEDVSTKEAMPITVLVLTTQLAVGALVEKTENPSEATPL